MTTDTTGVARRIVAVIGAGTMGAGIAEVAARAGHRVRVIDSQAEALERGRAGVGRSIAAMVQRGRLDAADGEATIARLSWHESLADAAGAALAIEAIVERIDAKTALFAALEDIVAPDCVLATNTSSLSVDAMAAGLRHPGRFVGLHFFNPVTAMKLVELVPAAATDPSVAAGAAALMRGWGKTPVTVRDVPGFIVNRVARPYYGEGFCALGEGVAPETVDALLTGAGGFRMGPLALADLIGHDVNFAVACSVYDAYAGRTRFRPQDAQRSLVEAGRLGRKSGGGVFASGGAGEPRYLPAGAAPRRVAAGPGAVLAPLIDRLAAAGVAIARDEALDADTIVVDGIVVAAGDGRTLASRGGCAVLLDAARDLATTDVLGLAARDEAAAAAAASLLAAAGIRAAALPDRPGLLVLRTLVQLANAAADALADGIAGEDDIDAAMRLGANHPQAPLAWARGYGVARTTAALNAIAAASGDAMYRPSSWFATGHA